MSWKYLLFSVLFVILLFLNPLSTQAATITVSGACTLVDAITAANTDTATGACPAGTAGVDVIELTANVTLNTVNNTQIPDFIPTPTGPNGLPIIDTEIIIMGNGFTIQRQTSAPQFRIFTIAGGFFGGGNLTLDNIIIRNGNIDIGTNCFTVVEQCGGAILNYFGSLAIRNNSQFYNNTAYAGGAIYNVVNSTTSSIVTISDSIFGSVAQPNTASSSGGAIYNTGNEPISISNTSFIGNQAQVNGGAIYNRGYLDIVDSTFTNNQALGTTTFTGGGAIYNTSFNGQLFVVNSTIDNNSAYRGGGIANYNASTITLTNSDVSNNTLLGFGSGGGIHNEGSTATINLLNSRVRFNDATASSSNGGGIYNKEGVVLLEQSTISNNEARHGGGIYSDASNTSHSTTIINSHIENNTASGDGGGIAKDGVAPMDIDSSFISGNSSATPNGDGGGIYINNGTSFMHEHTIWNTTISGNTAGEGAGIYSEAFTGTITIGYTTISGNTVITTGAVGEGGAGIANQHGYMNITNTTISGNRVENSGGSLSGSGGAIHNGNGGTINIDFTTIANNSANSGGGIRNTANLTLDNSILATNTANSGPNCNPSLTFTDGGDNLTDDGTNCPATINDLVPINLLGLADNGGPTQTHALDTGSFAINYVTTGISSDDQRGVSRSDGVHDSGAYEAVTFVRPILSFASATSSIEEIPDGTISVDITLDNTLGNLNSGTVEFYIGITGTAANGNDYILNTTIPVTFSGASFPAVGTISTVTVDFDIQADYIIEGNETIILSLSEQGIVGSAELGAITQHTITIIDGLSDLDLSKTVDLTGDANGDGIFNLGDTVTYTIVLTNNGPKDAVDITIEDALDTTSLNLASAIITSSTGTYSTTTNEWSQDGAGTGNGFLLSSGSSATLTIEIPILLSAAEGQAVNNTAQISQAFPAGAADSNSTNDSASVRFVIGTTTVETTNGDEGDIDVFDPALSKIGFLLPGQLGVQGEQLEWVITVSNPSGIAGQNIVLQDTLRDELQIDSVQVPNGASYTINGQTVTVTIPLLNPNESVQYSIFTTVIAGGIEIDNTVCLTADNATGELCITAFAISQLPLTGEAPWWSSLLWLILIGGISIIAISWRHIQRIS